MFDHIFLNVSNKTKSTKFYKAALSALGIKLQMNDETYSAFGTKSRRLFWLHQEVKSGATRNMHLAFDAKTRKAVQHFYKAALANGGKSNGEPGSMPDRGKHCYGAYVFDPDGNNIEVVCYAKE